MVVTRLDISGMHCSSCADHLASRLQSVSGVSSATVSFARQQATIHHAPKVPLEKLVKMINKAGYSVRNHADSILRILLVPGIVSLVILLVHVLVQFSVLPNYPWIGIVQVVLASIVVYYGRGIFRSGLSMLLSGKPGMDTLVALGTGVAYVWSLGLLVHWLFGGPYMGTHMHTLGVAMVLVFVMFGRQVEQRVRSKSIFSLQQLARDLPDTVRVVRNKKEADIAVSELKIDDVIRVRSGDIIPVDGVITVGASRVDESMLTGESKPVKKSIHDEVYAGTRNTKGMFFVRVTQSGSDSVYQKIERLVEKSLDQPAQVQELSDTFARVLVPVVVVVSVAAGLYWGMTQSLLTGITAAVSVLIIACPCAYGLATPTAIAAATTAGARRGILFRSASALQRLAIVKLFAFDKTGTLTTGSLTVGKVRTYGVEESILLRYVASLEQGSDHPLARAIVAYTEKKSILLSEPRKFEEVEGRGVRGKVEGREVIAGSIAYFRELDVGIYDVREHLQEFAKKKYSPVLVAIGGKLAGLIGVADTLREDAKSSLADLRAAGCSLAILSGDQKEIVRAISHELEIDVVRSEILPAKKRQEIKKFRKRRSVAMVGDGINDAAAIAEADVGIAVGSARTITIEAADIVIPSNSLSGVTEAYDLSQRTLRIVKQNLVWAFGYNIVAIPVAAGVLVPYLGWMLMPTYAGIAMAASSILVVLNSSRLLRKPD